MNKRVVKNREAILQAIEQGAGTYDEIMNITGLSHSAVKRHFDTLKQEGIIDETVKIDGRKIRAKEETKKRNNENRKKILDAIEQGANTYTEIVNTTGLSNNVVRKTFKELVQEGTINETAIISKTTKTNDRNKQKVLEAITQGASTYTEIIDITGLSHSAIKKSFDILKQEGTIDETVRIDGRKIGAKIRKQKINNENRKKVLEAITQGASTFDEIKNTTGLSSDVVRKYFKELVQEGMINETAIMNKTTETNNRNKQKVLQAITQGASTYTEIINITGLSHSTIKKYFDILKQEGTIDETIRIDGRKIGAKEKNNENRKKILQAITQGANTYDEIIDITGLSSSAVRKHFKKLVQEGMINETAIIRKTTKTNKDNKQKVLEAIAQGASTYDEIMAATGFSRVTVGKYFKELAKEGIVKEKADLSDENRQKVLQAITQGASTYDEIVDATGLCHVTVRKYLKKLTQEGLFKEKTKISDENRQKVLQAIIHGANTYGEIANITGLSYNTIKKYFKELTQEGIIGEEEAKLYRNSGRMSEKTKRKILEDKIKIFDKKLKEDKVTPTDALIFENLIINNSDTINPNIAKMVIIGLLKTSGKDGFKLACDFYDKCIELLGDNKNRKLELKREVKKYLDWHKSKIDAANLISKMLDQGGAVSLYDIAASTGLDITEVLEIKELLEKQRRRAIQNRKKDVSENER